MKRIINLSESDLTRIVKRVLSEQSNVPSPSGRKTVSTAKDTARAVLSSGEIDYNYIENDMPIDELHALIHDAITTLDGGSLGNMGDDEAVVEAAFLRILKEKNPKDAYNKVSKNYLELSGNFMWNDIKKDINVMEKYHKQSLKKSYDLIQNSGNPKPVVIPANDKLCKYNWQDIDPQMSMKSTITKDWGFESLMTFQKWCKNDAKKYFFRNKNNGITQGMCSVDGKIGCCTATCVKGVEYTKDLLSNIKQHSERANRIY